MLLPMQQDVSCANSPSLRRIALTLAVLTCALLAGPSPAAAQINGVLRKHPTNGRYFTDNSGKAIYLTGSHTWANLLDGWLSNGKNKDPAPAFDFDGYLNAVAASKQNFIRLWTNELPKVDFSAECKGPAVYYPAPSPWLRTGPGNAADGKPKFDLSQLNQAYFDRLRNRVIAARNKGIYVAIMLFEGYSIREKGGALGWNYSPFNKNNNIAGLNGDTNGDGLGRESHTLAVPAIVAVQEAYLRKVIDTVNDLDNVLYEVSNEEGAVVGTTQSRDWHYHVLDFVRAYEQTKPKQHPIGLSCIYEGSAGRNDWLTNSTADWIAPWGTSSSALRLDNNPQAASGAKVAVADTDHIFGVGGDADWVWRVFTRGYNALYMDFYGPIECGLTPAANYASAAANRAMGQTLTYAKKMDLAAMTPQPGLSSTGYCLAQQGVTYLVYQPGSGAFTVNLAQGSYVAEWLNPASGAVSAAGSITASGGSQSFTPPFSGPAVLYVSGGQGGPGPATLLFDDFDDGSPATNTKGQGSGWNPATFNGAPQPSESGGALHVEMGTINGIGAIHGKDSLQVWNKEGAAVTWVIKDITIQTPHKFGSYLAYCWELGIISNNISNQASSWLMSGQNKKGGLYVSVGKKNSSNEVELFVVVSSKQFSGKEGAPGLLYVTRTATTLGPRWTATFPIAVTVKLDDQGWSVSTNQTGVAPVAGNWTTDLISGSNDASISDEFASGVFLFTAGRNHGIDGTNNPFAKNSGSIESVKVETATTPPPPPGQAPYHGTPFVFPTTIEAEDFDLGGEGVAYHDAEAANKGGAYRPAEGVDIAALTAGGHKINWVREGEWLEYSVDVPAAGVYAIGSRVASDALGGVFHIEFDGVDKTGPIAVPNTGGWETFQTVDVSVTLPAGPQVMRVVFDVASGANGLGVADVDAFIVTTVSLLDAGPTDGSSSSVEGGGPKEAGTKPTTAEGGCGCRAGGSERGGGALVLLFVLLVLGLGRRRHPG